MRISGSRTPHPPNPFDEFNGPWGGAAINAQIQAANPLDTIELPARIFTLETIVWDRPLNVIQPSGGTKIFGSLAVRTRPMNPSDPGWAQVSSTVRASVRVVDLKQNGITSWGEYMPFTGPNTSDPMINPYIDWSGGRGVTALGAPALICDGRQMELVRWIPSGPVAVDEPWTFSKITGIVTDYLVWEDTSIPSGWSSENWNGYNLSAVNIYPSSATEAYDYFSSATISYPGGIPTVTLVNAIPNYPYFTEGGTGLLDLGCRFVIQNVLEELLAAGQYYIDVSHLLFYFIPPDANPGHEYRISWATDPLMALYADDLKGCSGISFTGGPLGLYGCRGQGFVLQGAPSEPAGGIANVIFDSLQAFGVGQDAFQFQTQDAGPFLQNWNIGQLVVDWSGGAGLVWGTMDPWGFGSGLTIYPPIGFPVLDHWNSTFSELYFGRTAQWCRTYRGALCVNCVGCTFEYITSIQNPAHHIFHNCHDTSFLGGYLDATFMEAGDVGVIYSANDPTIFGTLFEGLIIANISSMTDERSGFASARIGIYVDNTGSGVTARDVRFYNCTSGTGPDNYDPCILINLGQANTIDGVTTVGCLSYPVGMASWATYGGTNPFAPFELAHTNIQRANLADGRYQAQYGQNWVDLLSAIPYPGAPRNNAIYRVFPFTGSSPQPNWDRNSLLNDGAVTVSVEQPQGAVPALSIPPPPAPPSW